MKTYDFQIDDKTKRFVKKYDDGYGARNSTLTVSISEDLKNEVKALAKKENETVSNMVNKILSDHLTGGSNHLTDGNDLYIIIGDIPVALVDLRIIEIRSGRIAKQPKASQPFKKSFLNRELFKIGGVYE